MSKTEGEPRGGQTEWSRQIRKVSRELAQASGVDESDVRKVLDQLGVADLDQLIVIRDPHDFSLHSFQSAVKKALTVVIQ